MSVASSSKENTNLSGTTDQQQKQHFSSASRSPPSRIVKKQDIDSASDASGNSGESSDRRDVDILAQVLSTRSEEYRLLFRLPSDEVLIEDFNCALQENILLQGHLYLFIHHICFYSNIFGFETKKIISFTEITSVRKAKTAAIFPTSIEIVTGEKKHFFGSFLSRDEAYRRIVDGWAQHNGDVRAYIERQEFRDCVQHVELVKLRSLGEMLSWCNNFFKKKDSNAQDAIVLDKGNERQQPNGSNAADRNILVVSANGEFASGISHSEESPSWTYEDVDSPNVPEYFSKVAEAKFPVSLDDFFNLFFSDDATEFIENFRRTCGDKDFQCTGWHHNVESGLTRSLSFQHPIKIYFGAKFGHCQELQKFRAYRNKHLVVEISQQVSDIPYGDYFHVQGLWDIEGDRDSEENCTLRVYVNVAFIRKTIWKGKIEQSTRDEYQEVSGFWIQNARELLKQKNHRELEDTIANYVNTDKEQHIGLKSLQTVENVSENIHVSPHSANTWKLHVQNFIGEWSGITTAILAFLKNSLANTCTYLKSGNALFWIIIVVSVIIFTQLSIVILLIRTREVHLVSEMYSINGLNSGVKQETIDWLEKRVFYLTEEMLMMETRLERMHQEYNLLKAHLQAITQFKHKT